jgi:hypothetical protein
MGQRSVPGAASSFRIGLSVEGSADIALPRAGHDLRTFQLQTLTHANCESPRVHDPRRVRTGPVRARRQSRNPHRRKGRYGRERLAGRNARLANLDPWPRREMADLDHQIRPDGVRWFNNDPAGSLTLLCRASRHYPRAWLPLIPKIRPAPHIKLVLSCAKIRSTLTRSPEIRCRVYPTVELLQ